MIVYRNSVPHLGLSLLNSACPWHQSEMWDTFLITWKTTDKQNIFYLSSMWTFVKCNRYLWRIIDNIFKKMSECYGKTVEWATLIPKGQVSWEINTLSTFPPPPGLRCSCLFLPFFIKMVMECSFSWGQLFIQKQWVDEVSYFKFFLIKDLKREQ